MNRYSVAYRGGRYLIADAKVQGFVTEPVQDYCRILTFDDARQAAAWCVSAEGK